MKPELEKSVYLLTFVIIRRDMTFPPQINHNEDTKMKSDKRNTLR